MTARLIPQSVTDAQARASDPAISTFVSANAGSGKTHVLVSRVIRLMLSGIKPDAILCITFTKAAAANMQSRVFETLGRWVALDDEALRDAVATTGAGRVDAQALARARRLFAEALETPGGLKVLTIHALCTRLLQQFPFEADVPARFTVIEERDRDEMLTRATLAVLLDAAATPDGALGAALAIAMREAADLTLHDVVRQAVLAREHHAGWLKSAGGVDGAMAELCGLLGAAPDDTADSVAQALLTDAHPPASEWATIADTVAAAKGAKETDQKFAARLRAAAQADSDERSEAYLAVFLTGDGADLRKNLLTKAVCDALPALHDMLEAEKARIAAWCTRRNAVRIVERTRAMLTLAESVIARYEAGKHARGLLDFDDLIGRTLALLESGYAEWVHYKLDRGIDHVLVDEAQDTSPRQWDIIARLVAEFTAGSGARETKRTLFAVGDEKQSIFSFQGAAPREFAERRRHFRMLFRQAELAWDDKVRLSTSFRSGEAILDAVDSVFAAPDVYASIHEYKEGPQHSALRDAAPALVDLWPPEEPGAEPEPEGWRAPLDTVSEASPIVRLARRIAAHARELTDGTVTTRIGDKRRALDPGDIIVLVRKRGPLFDALIQALKRARVPVAGADRLQLTGHIAVADLMVLGDALLLPQDDLALATALKSPLFGLDEDTLMQLAAERTDTLRAALLGAAGHALGLADIASRFEAYLAQAARLSPFGFYSWLLNADGGRARMLGRLDLEAADALDEFLELATQYERRGPASLQGFLAFLRAAETEVKRDMEGTRGEVRVMTVHGAKGLEAPVVFLADTVSAASGGRGVRLIRLARGNDPASASQGIVWAGRKDDDPKPVAEARARMQADENDEHRRLLYVAMTRAADRLIVGCALNRRQSEPPPDSWYRLIRDGLERSALARRELELPHGPITRFYKSELEEITLPPEPERHVAPPEPDWLRQRIEPAPAKRLWLRPSDVDADAAPPLAVQAGESARQRQHAIRRGVLVHRLLQSLPDLPQDARAEAGARFLARNAAEFDASAQRAMLADVLALISSPRFGALFAPGSRAETSIAGTLKAHGRADIRISGQTDRLAIAPDHVLIADYKTGRPPEPGAPPPDAYVRQLALYRAVLQDGFPGRDVRAALIWTETPELAEISSAALDAALTQIISA